ncbi:MAG: D-lyxose/D-mannose family sugar isomerase [Chloroflexi bacterium]|nr:MAG: D-lyxose/D-mannose family sugar isomerase [Chloroflexota bacterium]
MITRAEFESAKKRAADMLANAGVVVNRHEIEQMEVADFGLSELEQSGAQIITLVDTGRIAVKLLVMLPGQTEPEHSHPKIDEYAGKEETVRCEWGELYLYGPGQPTPNPVGRPPEHRRHTYTVWHEHILHPGNQVTFEPDTPHWFQGGPEGCVFWSFSTKVTDRADRFTDPDIRRETVVTDE